MKITRVKTTDVTFDEFRQFLLELGFRETPEKTRLRFEHPSGPILLFRLYKNREKVLARDMWATRHQLDQQGVIEATDFDRLLQKTPA
jgi:hypothetical protein